jgi:hypothetical protein
LLNAILQIVHPELWETNTKAIPLLLEKLKNPLPSWPSVYPAMDIIANRETPRHFDTGGENSFYDHLVSIGQKHDAHLMLPDLHGTFAYQPGTSVLFSGKVLAHSCPKWSTGERVVIAHYAKDDVQAKLGISRPALPTQLGWWTKYS